MIYMRAWYWKSRWLDLSDRIWLAVARALPRKLAYWCAIRVTAEASSGKYGDTIVPELTAMEAARRFEGAS